MWRAMHLSDRERPILQMRFKIIFHCVKNYFKTCFCITVSGGNFALVFVCVGALRFLVLIFQLLGFAGILHLVLLICRV